MLSKAQIKYIRSLTQQKYRKEHQVFIVEGDKIAKEWLNSNATITIIASLNDWAEQNAAIIKKHPEAQVAIISEEVLHSISLLQTPNQVLLVVAMPEKQQYLPTSDWCIALDDIQDPGNMGTIIRIADWFGIKNIVCSHNCVEIYNPKVIQAAMGGHLRISFFQTELTYFIKKATIPTLAASLDGKNLYDFPSIEKAILIIGNESKGISKELLDIASEKINIPRIGGAESLNAAVSAGIICSHIVPH